MGVDDGYKTSNEAVSRAKKMMKKQRNQSIPCCQVWLGTGSKKPVWSIRQTDTRLEMHARE